MPKRNLPDGWHSWQAMKQRCHNPNHPAYPRYGGRGIKVCLRWRHSFKNFLADMGPRPTNRHTIERKHNDKSYTPQNCIWATYKEQMNNKRNNRLLSHGGKTLTLSQWSEELGITIYALHQRLARGRSVKWSLTFRPPLIEYKGKKLSATDWAKEVAIKANTIAKRIEKGWTPEEALTTPTNKDPWKRQRRF